MDVVTSIRSMDEFRKVINDETRFVVVDFSAAWCGPCKVILPYIQELAKGDLSAHIAFCKVDVDDTPDVAEYCGVSAMPTFMAYKNGVKVGQTTGANKANLNQFLDSLIA
jgi:thioredoxin 1